MKPGVKILSCASIVTSADTDDGLIAMILPSSINTVASLSTPLSVIV